MVCFIACCLLSENVRAIDPERLIQVSSRELVVALVMGCTYKMQDCKIGTLCFAYLLYFSRLSFHLDRLKFMPLVFDATILNPSSSYESQVCINMDIPKILALEKEKHSCKSSALTVYMMSFCV